MQARNIDVDECPFGYEYCPLVSIETSNSKDRVFGTHLRNINSLNYASVNLAIKGK